MIQIFFFFFGVYDLNVISNNFQQNEPLLVGVLLAD